MKKLKSSNYIFNLINNNIYSFKEKINVRFSPEISGYLHLGHLKNITINLDIIKIYNGNCNLRIDDTNPEKNKIIYKKKMIKDIKWFTLIFKKKFLKNIFYCSNYFHKLYQYLEFFKKKLLLIRRVKNCYYKEKKKLIVFKKNTIYRIKIKNHYRTKYNWLIFPLYDWAHVLSDKIEKIKYSICSIEFSKKKKIYVKISNIIHKFIIPIQIEHSRLLINNNITNKRLIILLIKNKYIKNYFDSRISTIKSIKNSKIELKKIYLFFKRLNLTRKKSTIYKDKIKKIEKNELKQEFNIIYNYINILILNFSKKIFLRTKKYFFIISNNILLEKEIFVKIILNKIFFLKKFNKLIKLKNLKIIICKNYIKNKNGEIKYIKCKYLNLIRKIKKNKWINNLYKNKIIFTKKDNLVKKNNNLYLNSKTLKIIYIYSENLYINNLNNKINFNKNKILKKNKINNKIKYKYF